ncbi:hypothetical protein [Moorena sp. SIO4G3]|uniref:hypothetical protein n=1 Tax=Moorena sp. SIO4G3 TaxID=2607821 RepID=UPI0025E61204|nr:hypothetical protein [Moorena sp. SIO4G3]
MVCSRSPLAWPTAKRGLRPSYRKIVEPCQPCKARVGETPKTAQITLLTNIEPFSA